MNSVGVTTANVETTMRTEVDKEGNVWYVFESIPSSSISLTRGLSFDCWVCEDEGCEVCVSSGYDDE